MTVRRTLQPVIIVAVILAGVDGVFAKGGWRTSNALRVLVDFIESHIHPDFLPAEKRARFILRAINGGLSFVSSDSSLRHTGHIRRVLSSVETAQSERRCGLGLSYQVVVGTAVITHVEVEGAAAAAGLRRGDLILQVDGKPVATIDDLDSVLQVACTADNGPVALRVIRKKLNRMQLLKIKRTPIAEDTVESLVAARRPSVAYLRMRSMSQDIPLLFRKHVANVTAAGAQALVIDLRDNMGGDMRAAADLCGFFVPGATVFQLEFPTEKENHNAPKLSDRLDLPIVLMTNNYTASAAEVMAATLQAHGTALVVGQRTYGKGVAQEVFPVYFKNGRLSVDEDLVGAGKPVYQLVLSTGYIRVPTWTAKGTALRRHHEIGVRPDIEVTELFLGERPPTYLSVRERENHAKQMSRGRTGRNQWDYPLSATSLVTSLMPCLERRERKMRRGKVRRPVDFQKAKALHTAQCWVQWRSSKTSHSRASSPR